jgi:hypothetical protein
LALGGVLEPVLVWLLHGEVSYNRTLPLGAVVFVASLAQLAIAFRTAQRL